MATKQNKWKLYAHLSLLLLGIGFVTWAVSGYIAYPTTEHKNLSAELNTLTNDGWKNGTIDTVTQSERYKELENTSQVRYSRVTDFITLIISIVVSIVLTVYVYLILRRDRISEKPALVTGVIGGISTALLTPITMLLDGVFYPISSDFVDIPKAVLIVLTIPLAFGIAFLLSYIIARITQWYYNRKYSFIDE